MDRIGRYEIVRPLGEGGMGTVFLARDPTLERLIALKVLRPEVASTPRARARLIREAKALARLSHPGIVTVHDVGRDGDRDFIAMEFLDGKSLDGVLHDGISFPRLCEIAGSVASALAAAHDAGVLHRDVKPANVMVLEDSVKVVDFGLAHQRGDFVADPGPESAPTPAPLPHHTDPHGVFGTPGYIAPECLRGEKSTPASDVFGLGVLFYEGATGANPFAGKNITATTRKTLRADRPPSLADLAKAPAHVSDIVDQALLLDPTARPSMQTLARVFKRASDLSGAQALSPDATPLTPALDTGPAPPKNTRAAIYLFTALALAAATLLVAWLAKEQPSAPIATELQTDASSATPTERPALAVPPFRASALNPDDALEGSDAAAHIFAGLLRRSDTLRVIGIHEMRDRIGLVPFDDPDWDTAAETLGATHMVSGVLTEQAGQLEATLEIR
ncbi:MAG: serine/threonine-protein kinase [Myxococcota bacterium]